VVKGLLLALEGFSLFIILHVLLFRLHVPERRFRAMVQIVLVLGLGLVVVHRTTSPDLGGLLPGWATAGWAVDLFNGLLVFGFLFVGYSMFYFLVDRGFSGRIMIEIETSPERRLRQVDIASRYSLEMVLRRRLTEMVEIGQVVEQGGRFRTTAKGRRAAALFALVKRSLRLGEGG
jgi:thiosulfate reductase cytochrome b subunit